MLTDPTDFRRLFLFRHPELDAAHQGLAVGSGPAALSRRGRAQTLDWTAWMELVPLAAVHSSPQPQCSEPAAAIAKPKELTVETDPRLLDQHMGDWQGRSWQELAQQDGDRVRSFFTDFGDVRAPAGESLGEAVERVLSWWMEQAPQLVGKSVALVLPGSVLSGFVAAMLGFRLSRSASVSLPHGGLGVLDAYDNAVRLQCWNPGAVV